MRVRPEPLRQRKHDPLGDAVELVNIARAELCEAGENLLHQHLWRRRTR